MAGRLLAAREAIMAPIRPILREAGITEQQWRVLRVLIDDGALDLSTLARNAMLRPPSLTRILRELLARRLITRDTDASDARRSIVSIAPAGQAVVDETTEATLAALEQYAQAFGVDRLRDLLRELAMLTEAIAGPEGVVAVD